MADDTPASNTGTPIPARRSFTVPIRRSDSSLSRRDSSGSSSWSPEAQVETLFQHPSVRIVAFVAPSSTATARPGSSRSTSTDGDGEEDVGTLPWTSSLERTIAVGPLKVYRAPGSVVFINCGSVVQAILPKSRCWCVDDASSKFVLQKRRPQYWRIEVPSATEDDRRRSEEFKDVLSQILLFEKTVCPFWRSFTVILPESPKTPLRKKPWKPVERQTLDASPTTQNILLETNNNQDYYSFRSDGNEGAGGMNSDSDATDDTNSTLRNSVSRSTKPWPFADLTNRPESMQTSRSVTAPPQLTLITSPPSKQTRSISPLQRSVSIESTSSDLSSSINSFHTVQSWHSPITPLPPSPPESNPNSPQTYPHPLDNIILPKRSYSSHEISETTIAPETPRIWHESRSPSPEGIIEEDEEFFTPSPTMPTGSDDIQKNLDEEHFEIVTSPASKQPIRHRPTTGSNSRRRALSPLPPAANIFSPSRQRPRCLQTARNLPTAIIQKTYEILLSPPSHLLHLMLDIAAKIAAGEWRGMIFGFGEEGERVIGQWDYDEGESMESGCSEDDYGIDFLGSREMRRRTSRGQVGGSWEVD